MDPAPVKAEIDFSAFEAVDIRVGTIVEVNEVPNADKLMQLIVDLGDHRRSIVAGIKQERDNPQEIVGTQALFVVNLAPRKMRGVLSEGMLFDAGYADGVNPALLGPERPLPNGHPRRMKRIVGLVVVVVMGCDGNAPPPASQNPSPMIETTRTHQRLPPEYPDGRGFEVDIELDTPAQVFVPPGYTPPGLMLVHFHGSPVITAHAVAQLDTPIVGVTVHLGAGSSTYERPFQDADRFTRLVAAVNDSFPSHTVIVSAFSAGYGAVRALLANESPAMDAVVLLDGLHTDYVPERTTLADGGTLNADKLQPFATFARRAMNGEATFHVWHSTIFPGTYASTTETADWLLTTLGMEREPTLEWGPRGMQQLSVARSGSFEVRGFAGNSAPDHVDHLHALPEAVHALLSPQ